jgi:predicted nucleotidyltransferase
MNMETLPRIPAKYQEDIRKASNLLKSEGCKAVYLFGSMITGKIHESSDIDIGIKGLPPENFFKVYSKLYRNLENEVDLVDFDEENQFFSILEKHGEIIEIG